MHNLTPLESELIDEFDLILSSKQDPAHLVLTNLRNILITRFNLYQQEFNNNNLENINTHNFTQDARTHLMACYSNSTKALDDLLARIKDNQPLHIRSICQYCCINTDSTTDHYLPQSQYPEFSVNHLNLFPCCADCNPKKNNYWYNLGNFSRGIINLYSDNLPNIQFLFVKLYIFGNVASINYYIENINGIDADLYTIIENHFIRLNLAEKYTEKTNYLYNRMYNMYNKPIYRGNPDLIRDSLLIEVAQHYLDYGRNHYEGVLMEALANNYDFLNLF